jgi:threonine/homoserine/homoserine lactone efflux protein
MPSLSIIAAFAAASIVLLVIPGPAVLYIVNRSVTDGRTVGLAAVAGVQLGTFVHAAGAALGLSAVLATSAVAFTAVKWLGAGYLVYVGVRTLATRPPAYDPTRPGMTPRRAFRQGFVVNLFNPKVALFFLSFLPQFIRADHGRPAVQAMILGLVFCTLGVLSDGSYSLLASSLRNVLVKGRALPFVQRYVAGTVFIGLGVVAATATTSGVKSSSSTS